MLYRLLVVSHLAVLLAGCAVHPLPENVTGVDTPDIVRQIRCESREAVIHEIRQWLTSLANAGDQVSQQLLTKYDADPESISNFNAKVFPTSYVEERRLVNLFYGAGIAYTFDLKMSENNDLNPPAAVDLIRPSVEGLLMTELKHDLPALAHAAVRANIRASVRHLRHGSEIIEQLIQKAGLLVVGAEYSLETGVVDFFDGLSESDS